MYKLAFECFIPGEPVARQEPKIYGNKGGRRNVAKDPKVVAYEEKAALYIKAAKNKLFCDPNSGYCFPINRPVELNYYLLFTAPKSIAMKLKKSKYELHIKPTEPDFDNVCKPLGDILERSGILTNDSRIANPEIFKFWTIKTPGVVIQIKMVERLLYNDEFLRHLDNYK